MPELSTEEYAARAAIPPPPDIEPPGAGEALPRRPFAVLTALIALMVFSSICIGALFMPPSP